MLTNWDQWFPSCEPVAHLLRDAFPDRWVRFHSLPDSKRYPETEAEYAIVLERHNRVLGELAGTGERVVLMTTGYSDMPEAIRTKPEVLAWDPHAKPWRCVPLHRHDGGFAEPTYWHVFVSERFWRPGLFDALVRKIADNVLANVMMVAVDGKWLLHPYDGGMDAILESSAARDEPKEHFRLWLSWRPDGM
jgi:hypothetical protein